jgi:hypothetical protein
VVIYLSMLDDIKAAEEAAVAEQKRSSHKRQKPHP